MQEKFCNNCGETKDLSEFYKRSKLSYRQPCKKCINERTFQWIKNNPEKRRAICRKHYLTKGKTKQSETTIRHQIKFPEKYLWNAAKGRCSKNGFQFDIEVSDVVIPEVCPVFKTPFVRGTDQAASLDRINSEMGYIKGNVQVISRKANEMKSNATPEQLKQFAEWILT